jgi:predicted RNA-binding protein with RPS1 domain
MKSSYIKKTFKGEIVRSEFNYKGEYIVIQDKDSNEEFWINSKFIDKSFSIGVGEIHEFSYTKKNNDKFPTISIINSNYPIGSLIEFEVTGRIFEENKNFLVLSSSIFGEIMVPEFYFQKESKNVKCEIVNYKNGEPIFHNRDFTDSPFQIGDVRKFEVKEFGEIEIPHGYVKKFIKVDIGFDIHIDITNPAEWHNSDLWNFNDIECEVIDFNRFGIPRLKIVDQRHPYFEINKPYKFKVLGFEESEKKDGTKIKLIKLSDEHELHHNVLAIPNQENRVELGSNIECEVIEILKKIKLKQVKVHDPFYYKFEEIEPKNELKEKFFTPFLNDNSAYNYKLFNQYNNGSGFWIMTYLNHIVPELSLDITKRKDFNTLKKLLELRLKFNKWLINNGFLQGIKETENRKLAKNKVTQSIELCQLELFVLSALIENKQELILDKNNTNIKVQTLYFYLLHSDLENVNFSKFYSIINSFNWSEFEDSLELDYLKKIVSIIRLKVGNVNHFLEQNSFILHKNVSQEINDKIEFSINWIFLCHEISKNIKLLKEHSLYLSEVFRLFSLHSSNIILQRKLLYTCFKILTNQVVPIENPFQLVNNKIEIKSSFYDDDFTKTEIEIPEKSIQKVILTEKNFKGFSFKVNSYIGYLPNEKISDNSLKNYTPDTISWETAVEIKHICDFFGICIVQQLPISNKAYFSKNLLVNFIERGAVIWARVKDITDYGIFVSTEFGEGLIHKSEIAYDFIDQEYLKAVFKKNLTLRVVVIENENGKLQFSLKQLIGTEYENDYNQLIENSNLILLDNYQEEEEYEIQNKLEEEKGYIFDRAAMISFDLKDKIKYLIFSKYFFSNTKNARSYLTNIYIDYFLLLLKLDDILSDYTFEKYKLFKLEIDHFSETVSPKTLENFPESKNLLFFIEILRSFNSSNHHDLDKLYDIVRNSMVSNDYLLMPVAKTALANNLLISEIKDNKIGELNRYTLKNLNRIREFITKGVLTVTETVEDVLELELEKKRKYWKGKILQDEGEKLEFKSTFKTPVPTKKRLETIEHIEKQLLKAKDEKTKEKLQSKLFELNNEESNDPKIHLKLIHSALKSICAFANTYGGTLLLGVSDDKEIFGLEQDYATFKEQDRDSFGLYFDEMINNYFGKSFSSTHLKKEFLKFPEGDILIVEVLPSKEEIFLLKNENGEPEESIYVRHLSSSDKLKGIDLSKFIKRKMTDQFEYFINVHNNNAPNKIED